MDTAPSGIAGQLGQPSLRSPDTRLDGQPRDRLTLSTEAIA
jgi:hypothetical protein